MNMLKAYEVVIENGQVRWLQDQPQVKSARAIITILGDENLSNEASKSSVDHDLKLEELGGSEPEIQDIPRRRYA
jgi:hypothetical protein